MKSKPFFLTIYLIIILGFGGCSGKSGSDNNTNSENINLNFNSLDEIKIQLSNEAEKNLESQLLNSIDNEDLIDKIKNLELEIEIENTKIAHNNNEKAELNSQLAIVENEIKTILADQANNNNEIKSLKTNSSQDVKKLKLAIINIEKSLTESFKNLGIKRRQYDQSLQNLLEAQKRLSDLGLFDTLFEKISGVLTKQIAELNTKVEELQVNIKIMQEEHSNNEVKKKNLAHKVEQIEAEFSRNNNNQTQKLNEKIAVLNSKIEELSTTKDSKEAQIQIINQQKIELTESIISKQEKLKTLITQKDNSVNMEILKENDSAAAQKLKIIQELKEGKLSIQKIVKAIIATHFEGSNNDDPQINNNSVAEKFKNIIQRISVTAVNDFKTSYEDILLSDNSGNSLVYNKDYFRVTDPLILNKIQCYSGTMLFNILNELRTETNENFKNTVVIFTDGHIRAGYIEMKDGALYLKGIETTATGKAVVNFGLTTEIAGRIRVFDARQFLVAELLRGEIANTKELYNQMLKTVERYGFQTSKFHPFDESAATNSKDFNRTLFGFGTANVPAGDLERTFFDEQDNTDFLPTTHTNKDEELNPIEIENYGKLTSCKYLKIVIGDVDLLTGKEECLDDNKNIINLPSYKAKPINNSVSIATEGEVLPALIIDEYRNYNACTIHPGQDGKRSLHVNLDSNMEATDSITTGLITAQLRAGITKAPNFTYAEMQIFKAISLKTDNQAIIKMLHSEGTTQLLAEDLGLEVESSYDMYEPTEGTNCEVTIKQQTLSGIPGDLFHMYDIEKGKQLSITCPELQSETGTKTNVNIKINCAIATYSYNN